MSDISEGSEDILKQGCLVHLECSIWGLRKKIPKGAVNVAADPEYINAVKYLIDPHQVKPIETIRGSARSYLYSKSLPFPISGLVFVPRDMISSIDGRLEALRTEFNGKVSDFVSHYNTFVESAQEKLNGLFNPVDYPRDISQRFAFAWKYITLGAPDQAQLLSPEVYEREKQKFEQTMLEFRETAVNTLRASFSGMVERITERLSGQKKVFRDSLIGNIQEFLTDFDALNITNDTELSQQVKRCKAIMSSVNPDLLRSNSAFRSGIAASMANVQTSLNSMMVDRPKRKLRPAA
jgi:hypothetical protein